MITSGADQSTELSDLTEELCFATLTVCGPELIWHC